MKLLISFFILGLFNSAMAIDDTSFKNKDKYQSLNLQPIGLLQEFDVHATFYPPEGKKLNKASYIKIWEKKNREWSETFEINPEFDMGLIPEYKLEKKVKVASMKSDLAIEIEFIHCSQSGGQCAMERYLGKIKRKKKSDQKDIKLTLRID
jgi:hypothetical protein